MTKNDDYFFLKIKILLIYDTEFLLKKIFFWFVIRIFSQFDRIFSTSKIILHHWFDISLSKIFFFISSYCVINFRLCVWWKNDSRTRKKYCKNNTRWKTTENWKCEIVIKLENEIRTMKKNFTKKTNCFWWNKLKTSKNSSFQLFTLMKLNIKTMKSIKTIETLIARNESFDITINKNTVAFFFTFCQSSSLIHFVFFNEDFSFFKSQMKISKIKSSNFSTIWYFFFKIMTLFIVETCNHDRR